MSYESWRISDQSSEQAARAAFQEVGRLREALHLIANQGPHYGPDGTLKTWRHWADIARDAIKPANNQVQPASSE